MSMNRDVCRRIDRYVKAMTDHYLPGAGGEKIIHDPIWGSIVFYPWEVRLIDSPLFQRLRNINQVGLADSTYPAALHTRFEHSLGTTAVASRMMEQMLSDAKQRADVKHVIGEKEIRLVRLAALLHDVGHCPYSHLSEAVYGTMPEFAELRKEVLESTGQAIFPSPHEIFSYLIIVSDAFVSFFYRHVHYPGIKTKAQAKALLQQAANLVVGAVNQDENGTKYSYLTTVINGIFDADKLDYTQRDSYTAGIALTYGVERFLLKLALCKIEEDGVTDYRLAITSDALSTVEELIFNRSMLYYYMYRHQKVLAAEAQMRDAIYALVRVGIIKHPCDFLFLNNHQLDALYQSRKRPFVSDGSDKTLDSLIRAFPQRTLLKRALELSPDSFEEFRLSERVLDGTLEKLLGKNREEQREILTDLLDTWQQKTLFPQGIEAYVDFLKTCTTEEYLAERKAIAKRLEEAYQAQGRAVDFDPFDLAVAFPAPLKTTLPLTVVNKQRIAVDASQALKRMERWTETFNLSKWRGYFFVAPHVDRQLAGDVFLQYLKERCES
ncbi:MAG: HD domain-containing protein [Clostridia bacterium]|nr:HD domain-containing protein [Clostridia bacterium]